MKIIGVLSAVMALCSVGYVNASNVSFQFSDNDDGFKASAQYSSGYNCMSTYADDMSDFAPRVSSITNGTVSFTSTDRESFDLYDNCSYSLKPNRMGLHEYLKFSGVKFNSDLKHVAFNGTEEYQPTVILEFDSGKDANLPSIDCNCIPIIRFDVKNPNGNVIKLRDFKTNGVTGLSYNVPMSIGGCKCNNVMGSFKQLCMIATRDENNNGRTTFKKSDCERRELGYMGYIEIDNLTGLFGDAIKVKSFTSSATEPAASEVVARHVIIDTNLDDLKNINRSGKVVIDVIGKPEQGIMGSHRRKSKIFRACWNEQYLNQHPNFKKPVAEVLGKDAPNQRFFIIEVEKKA